MEGRGPGQGRGSDRGHAWCEVCWAQNAPSDSEPAPALLPNWARLCLSCLPTKLQLCKLLVQLKRLTQVEAEAIHVVLLHPPAQRIQDLLLRGGVVGVHRVAAAAAGWRWGEADAG